ncbi:MAG: L,D-transpeptidase family protein [Bacteroidetes bacterium]|nr:L,D-transpeptidase family protein [Bacteroidota bacterium]
MDSGLANTPEVVDSTAADTLPKHNIPVLNAAYLANFFLQHPELLEEQQQLMEFYEKRNFKCAWFNNFGLTEQAGKIVNLVTDYIQTGVVDTTVLIPGIVQLYDTVSADTFILEGNDSLILQAEVMFSNQFFAFSRKAWKGLKEEKLKKLEWFLPLNRSTQVAYLDSILSAPPSDIAGTEPVYKQFLLLKAKLKSYAAIQDEGGWNSISGFANDLKPGDTSEVISNVKQRMLLTGDYSGNLQQVFDSSLARAVIVTRTCFGLTPIAVIDKKLIDELNIPVKYRIRKILINLERWKWVPADPGSDFIAVNIPEFMLHVFESNKVVKSMKVIVGKAANKTVIFSGDLTYVVLSPYWVIPRSIVAKETLPAVKKNASYLAKHNMEVVSNSNPPKVISTSSIAWKNYNGSNFPYTIRQKPGPANSLGYVKFLFPNNYSIYLHDTPSRNLFEKEGRTFSHGCIRVAEPAWLANYLLRNDSSWTEEKIDKAMHGGKEIYITLNKKVPVYITYFTAWIDGSGKLNFRNDIYGHDLKLAKELFE